MAFHRAYIGHGVGLRTKHYGKVLEGGAQDADWMEAITENFIGPGGRPIHVLETARSQRPIVLHGVSMSIGGSDPLSEPYLAQVRALAARIQPAWISDHLCWGTQGGAYAHELLPLPYTEEALRHVVARVIEVQEKLGRQILLENVSTYVSFKASEMTEWEFLSSVARGADCGILLDVNNIYVNARNHGFDPNTFVDAIPVDRVGQIHLAGHTDQGTHLFDSHIGPVPDPVWDLYERTVRRFGAVSTLVEWDEDVPDWDVLIAERHRAAGIEARGLGKGVKECA